MDIFLRYLFWFFPFFFVPLHLVLKVNVILFEPTMDELADIRNKIYEIRSQRVMLDRDIAVFYGVETKRLNEKVKRNPKRFAGEDFMFQLTPEEFERFV